MHWERSLKVSWHTLERTANILFSFMNISYMAIRFKHLITTLNEPDSLNSTKICIFGDPRDHSAYTFNAFIEMLMVVIGAEFSLITEENYFLDVASSQYKNK